MAANGKRKVNKEIGLRAQFVAGPLPPSVTDCKFEFTRVDFAGFYYSFVVYGNSTDATELRLRLSFCPLNDAATVRAIDAVTTSMAETLFEIVSNEKVLLFRCCLRFFARILRIFVRQFGTVVRRDQCPVALYYDKRTELSEKAKHRSRAARNDKRLKGADIRSKLRGIMIQDDRNATIQLQLLDDICRDQLIGDGALSELLAQAAAVKLTAMLKGEQVLPYAPAARDALVRQIFYDYYDSVSNRFINRFAM